MAIVRWDPFRELVAMQERLNRFFDEARRSDDDVMTQGDWIPAVDIFQTDQHEVVLKAELPGLKREDIDVQVENNTLTIKGERRQEKSVAKEHYHRVERCYGTFSRSFSLPNTIDSEKVRAEYRNGVLSVTLPLREEAKPRQIQVDVKG
jgi:HSP20 family protein